MMYHVFTKAANKAKHLRMIPRNKAYYCNYCKAKLSYNGKEPDTKKDEWLCTWCNITFYPDNELVRKANKFETPGEQELLNASVDSDGNTSVPASGYFARQKLPPSFDTNILFFDYDYGQVVYISNRQFIVYSVCYKFQHSIIALHYTHIPYLTCMNGKKVFKPV